MKIAIVAAGLSWLLFCTSSSILANEKPKKVVLRFCAMGDVPYDLTEWDVLEKQIRDLPDRLDFIVHLGDIKRGLLPCFEPNYKRVADLLATSKAPAFIVLGDNEWNDCLRPAVGRRYWDRHLLKIDERWQHGFGVHRDPGRVENFYFVKNGVLVIGINIVGGTILDRDEWKTRHKANVKWVQLCLDQSDQSAKITSMIVLGHARPTEDHDDFFKPFVKVADKFDKPVLYLHGDGHSWEYRKDWKKKNITRVQVDQGIKAPPVLVTVESGGKNPFDFDRRGAGKKKD